MSSEIFLDVLARAAHGDKFGGHGAVVRRLPLALKQEAKLCFRLTGMALVGDISPVSSRGRAVNAGTACHGTNLYLTIRHRAEKHEC